MIEADFALGRGARTWCDGIYEAARGRGVDWFGTVASMVELRYLTECAEAVRSKVRAWAGAEEFAAQVAPDFVLGYEPGVRPGTEVRPGKSRRQHNWVIFADDEPVGVVFASIQNQRDPDSAEPDDPADYPCLGTATYIDLCHRGTNTTLRKTAVEWQFSIYATRSPALVWSSSTEVNHAPTTGDSHAFP
ncbi:hypothetical protein QX204_17125 [Nocardia sp. PE-7]|uniref:hypothetical protein n=1 Tax=Nocardia sp. PE-7 TaxID=3058426 RepID=UPI002658FA33|nr:hypothetical protein [Nocardia sp. PE-7]WKG13097.1 hypothetical protein QX204_17125 [Nocardia sp. PE-7]